MTIPMHTRHDCLKSELEAYINNCMSTLAEPKLLKEELYEAIHIQDSAYTKADLILVINNIKHLIRFLDGHVQYALVLSFRSM